MTGVYRKAALRRAHSPAEVCGDRQGAPYIVIAHQLGARRDRKIDYVQRQRHRFATLAPAAADPTRPEIESEIGKREIGAAF